MLDLLAGDDGGDVEARRLRLKERLRRMARAYTDIEMDEGTYESQRRAIEAELERLTLPTERAVMAAETFDVLQRAWAKATPQERRTIALALFEAVYVDMATKTIVDAGENGCLRWGRKGHDQRNWVRGNSDRHHRGRPSDERQVHLVDID